MKRVKKKRAPHAIRETTHCASARQIRTGLKQAALNSASRADIMNETRLQFANKCRIGVPPHERHGLFAEIVPFEGGPAAVRGCTNQYGEIE